MKIKRFNENIENLPDIGDYVIVNLSDFAYDVPDSFNELIIFLNTTIGSVIAIQDLDNSVTHHKAVVIGYDINKIPDTLKGSFDENGIKKISSKYIYAYDETIEGLKMKIEAKKYNI